MHFIQTKLQESYKDWSFDQFSINKFVESPPFFLHLLYLFELSYNFNANISCYIYIFKNKFFM